MTKLKNCTFQITLAIFAFFALYSCGQSQKEEHKSPPPTAKEQPEPIIQEKPVSHPVTAKTRETYQWYCSQCHGIKGKGNGINSPHVTVPPRNHTKAYYLETRSDEELFEAISKGGLKIGRAPCMPSWGATLDEKTIWSLVRYIRELCNCEAV
jgi:hypothetical protein